MNNDLETGVIIITFGALGVISAWVLNYLNTEGILIDSLITSGVTITDLMTVVVLLWVMVGVIVGALKR